MPPDPTDFLTPLTALLGQKPLGNREICLIVPPFHDAETIQPAIAKARRYMTHIPYGLLCLAAAVHQHLSGWRVRIVDLNTENLLQAVLEQPHGYDHLMETIPTGCALYGVSWMFVSAEQPALEIMKRLKARGVFLVAGGVQASFDAESLVEGWVDLVVKREAEFTLVRLLALWESVQTGQPWVPPTGPDEWVNLVFRHEGITHRLPERFQQPPTLDIREEYRKVNLPDYSRAGAPSVWVRLLAGEEKLFANVLNVRGCRARCTFCQVAEYNGRGVRPRGFEDVAAEIAFLYHEKQVRHIEWVDDDFLAHPDQALALLQAIAAMGLPDLTFSCINALMASSIDATIAQALDDAGFRHVGFGVESGSVARLKQLRKPVSLSKVKQVCELLKTRHPRIWIHANFMLGYPDETIGELLNTFEYARGLQIDWCACTVLIPLQNTPIHKELSERQDDHATRRLGQRNATLASPGRDLAYQKKSYDDKFAKVIDFRALDPTRPATREEIQQFHVFFTVFVNLLNNVNLGPTGQPERMLRMTEDTLRAYPMDPVSWMIHAECAKRSHDWPRHEWAMGRHRQALADSRFWQEFFELYGVVPWS
ncbi:MAG: radical SAM protein [Magnetococcales bacterium]|nr:radical SAM protein [Magnetococcales bacterium]